MADFWPTLLGGAKVFSRFVGWDWDVVVFRAAQYCVRVGHGRKLALVWHTVSDSAILRNVVGGVDG
jgi:hypothetical protein